MPRIAAPDRTISPRITSPQTIVKALTVTPVAANGREVWKIDRSKSPDSRPMSLQLAKAMIHLRREHGTATVAELIALGFTFIEINVHGDAARIRAAKLAPKLAHDTDRDFAARMAARQVA